MIPGFFELDTSEDLLEDRAKWIAAFWVALRLREAGNAADRVFAEARIREFLSPSAPHSRCLNAFHDLATADLAEAERVAGAMGTYLESKSRVRGG
ncbi:MAG TPA: hypothetical protein VF705_12760 [Longimicrobium sp.]